MLSLQSRIRDARLLPLAEKVLRGERLSFEDGLLLYETPDLNGVGAMAHLVRLQKHGRAAYYVVSRRLSYTNVCYTHCQFCAFQAKPGDPRAYALSAEEIIAELEKPENAGVRELHMTSGHNPKLKIDYFEDLFTKLKARFPSIHLKVFTMIEMDYYARISGLSTDAFLDRCMAAGLESCPGGGAEIFDEALRERICIGKKDAQVWLDTAAICHRKGLPTNCTMLYGHIEEAKHRVDHLLRLRKLQDESLASGYTGFLAYIPLAYQNEDNELSATHVIHETTGTQDLREIAVARLLLDNIPHIKAYWVMISPGLAQAGLSYGADDLDGTVIAEEIAHLAGAKSPQGLQQAELVRLIREAGFEALERDNLYNVYATA
ncbi:MAG: aminofutalosine synthase MqnE [Geothrix sp.]|jgi:aminodeoxyfutalosine synthase|uniref:Aminodeoxyfutalosine synthase n=1 Tax=Candidatus Geothrix odensensis TaxID=2954440 RepID=A0A936F098_9BACT|nr:aminofutalosine synthase MqnE [Candidatus Geothrix odensensis]MCC6512927.1 aminofutalosine synthase MqnE [Geothrix sp.]